LLVFWSPTANGTSGWRCSPPVSARWLARWPPTGWGYYGGKPLVLKVGRYLLLNRHDLELTERYFNRKQGLYTVFLARFIPVIRHFISIPAGMGKMPLGSFMVVSVVGATMWNGFLLFLGMRLREHWTVVQKYSHQVDIVIVALAIIGIGWFIRSRLAARKRKLNN
jgi:membrane protein DedA with SNARE-associated domain